MLLRVDIDVDHLFFKKNDPNHNKFVVTFMRTNLQMVHNIIPPKSRNNFSELLVRIGSDADKQAFSEIFEHFAARLKN